MNHNLYRGFIDGMSEVLSLMDVYIKQVMLHRSQESLPTRRTAAQLHSSTFVTSESCFAYIWKGLETQVYRNYLQRSNFLHAQYLTLMPVKTYRCFPRSEHCMLTPSTP